MLEHSHSIAPAQNVNHVQERSGFLVLSGNPCRGLDGSRTLSLLLSIRLALSQSTKCSSIILYISVLILDGCIWCGYRKMKTRSCYFSNAG